MKSSKLRWVFLIGLVMLCVATLFGQLGVGVRAVGQVEQAAVWGGETWDCIRTRTDCPDPNGLPATCSVYVPTGMCEECRKKAAWPSWNDCGTTTVAPRECSMAIPINAPFCGQNYGGLPPVMGSCAGRCTPAGGNCGQRIPNVTGTSCP